MKPIDAEFFEPAPPAPVKLRRRIITFALDYGLMIIGAAVVGYALGRALALQMALGL